MGRSALKRTPTPLPVTALATGGWGNTKDLLADIHSVMKSFDAGEIDAEAARVFVANFRNAAAILMLQLEHAKLTNRLFSGKAILPGIDLT